MVCHLCFGLNVWPVCQAETDARTWIFISSPPPSASDVSSLPLIRRPVCCGGLKLLSSDKIRRFLLAGDNKSAGRYNSFCARTIYIHGQDELWTWNGLWGLCNTDIFESGPLLLQSIQCYRNDGRAAALCSTDVMSRFCVLHIKSFMEAIKCTLNGEELAEWMYNWISSYDGAQSKTK